MLLLLLDGGSIDGSNLVTNLIFHTDGLSSCRNLTPLITRLKYVSEGLVTSTFSNLFCKAVPFRNLKPRDIKGYYEKLSFELSSTSAETF